MPTANVPASQRSSGALLTTILAGYLIIVLDISIVVTALAKIQASLGLSATSASWMHFSSWSSLPRKAVRATRKSISLAAFGRALTAGSGLLIAALAIVILFIVRRRPEHGLTA